MTLSVGIKLNNEVLVFTDCMVSEFSLNGHKVGTSEALKLSKIYEGIFFSMVGDENSCKNVRNLCRHISQGAQNIDEAFRKIKFFLLQINNENNNYEFLIISRHQINESSLYHYNSKQNSLVEIPSGTAVVLGSAKLAVEEKLKNSLSSVFENREPLFSFNSQFPRLMATYLNQWCFGDNVSEGYITNFGSRIIYIYQNEKIEILQPTSITVVVFHSLEQIKVRLFTHFWDDYGLIIYDSYKHNLNYLIDDNEENLKNIPSENLLFERMRDIYFNYPHVLYQYMFVPDQGNYDFFRYEEFKFKDGDAAVPVELQKRLNLICSHFKKSGQIVFGD